MQASKQTNVAADEEDEAINVFSVLYAISVWPTAEALITFARARSRRAHKSTDARDPNWEELI